MIDFDDGSLDNFVERSVISLEGFRLFIHSFHGFGDSLFQSPGLKLSSHLLLPFRFPFRIFHDTGEVALRYETG